jgi:hypothetical protein
MGSIAYLPASSYTPWQHDRDSSTQGEMHGVFPRQLIRIIRTLAIFNGGTNIALGFVRNSLEDLVRPSRRGAPPCC